MSLQETATFAVSIILSTENGELPDDFAVQRLINDQMSGELDEETGLACLGVSVHYRSMLSIEEER
jgi:hypothetical protein